MESLVYIRPRWLKKPSGNGANRVVAKWISWVSGRRLGGRSRERQVAKW
jgi:hypothetical protein